MKKLPYNVTDKYTKADFLAAGISKGEGYNCLSMMLDFCREELDLDYEFSKNILGDITWENVVKIFNDNPGEVFEELEKHFLNYYEIIPPHQMRKGDALSVDTGDGRKVPCIFAGNNKILITTDKGVKVISLFGIKVYNVYRIKETKKITTKAVYDMVSGKLLEEESYNYDGDIAECEAIGGVIYIIGYLISLILAIYTYFNMPDDPGDSELGTAINTRSTKEPLKTVYGELRVGGNDVFISTTGDHHKESYIVQTLSEGECEGVEKYLVDDIDPSGGHFGTKIGYTFYSGSSTQNYDPTINGIDPSWTENQRYTSYIAWKFYYDGDLYRGLPTRVVDLKGRRVLDFRTSTTAWSDNAVLCFYDFFTNDRYGLGVSADYIDIASWTAAANYFDSKGWSFNYETKGAKNPWTVILDMKRHFRGEISWFDGVYYLLISDLNEESSVMTITDEHIVQDGEGNAQVKLVQPSRFNKPDGIKVSFRDKEKNYMKDEIVIGEAVGVVQNVSFPGFTDRKTACDMGTYLLERARLNRTISGTFRDDCLELAPHDLITFNSTALSISGQPMRVVSTSLAGNGLINLSLQYESVDLYDDDYDVNIEGVYTCSLPDPYRVIEILNPAIAEETFYYRLRTESRLNITFTIHPDEPWFKHVEVWQAITESGAEGPAESDFFHQHNTTNDFTLSDNVEQGKKYHIKLIAVSSYDVKDMFANAPLLVHTVTGVSDAPQSLAFLAAISSNNSLALFSDKLTDPDIEIYEFRIGMTDTGDSTWETALFLSAKRTPNEQLPGIKPGDFEFYCSSKGTNGLYGSTPRSAAAEVHLPIGWGLNTTFTCDYDGVGTHDNTEHIVYTADDYLKCSHTSDVLTGTYTSVVYDTGVAAVDYYVYWDAWVYAISAGATWDGVIPDPNIWTSINVATSTWNEIFAPDAAPEISVIIKHKVLIGDEWSEVTNAEILSAIINARYFQVAIEIIDPSSEIYAYVQNFSLKLHTKT